MTEREFHTARRMFCVKNGELFIASEKDTRSHAQWFMEEGWMDSNNADDFMERIIRGMHFLGSLYFYKGKHFAFDEEMVRDVVKYLPVLAEELSLPGTTIVHFGPVDKVINGQEHKQKILGSIHELIQG